MPCPTRPGQTIVPPSSLASRAAPPHSRGIWNPPSIMPCHGWHGASFRPSDEPPRGRHHFSYPRHLARKPGAAAACQARRVPRKPPASTVCQVSYFRSLLLLPILLRRIDHPVAADPRHRYRSCCDPDLDASGTMCQSASLPVWFCLALSLCTRTVCGTAPYLGFPGSGTATRGSLL